MIQTDLNKIQVAYYPSYEVEEGRIFEKAFGKNNIELSKYVVKGLMWGAFDVEFIIQIASDPVIRKMMAGAVLILVKELFERNRKVTKNNRPRYTLLVLKKKTMTITVSNVNSENKVTLSKLEFEKKTIIKDFDAKDLKKLIEGED